MRGSLKISFLLYYYILAAFFTYLHSQVNAEETFLPVTSQKIQGIQDLSQRSRPSEFWNQPWSSGTRTDLKPEEILQQNQKKTESKTTTGVCGGIGAGVVGYKVCYDEEGTVSISANALGAQATIYGNPQTGNMGGGVGIGGELRLGPVGVGGSAIIAGDKEKGLVTKTSVSGGPAQITITNNEVDTKK